MKAAIFHRYGPPEVIRLAEVPTPAPKPGEVQIRIHATTVSSADWRLRSAKVPFGFGLMVRLMFGITGPRQPILGRELSGTVSALGPGVTRFGLGDAVIAYPSTTGGAHAEYICVPADGMVAPKPAALSHAEAAALGFGGITALAFLRDKANLRPGERLLVIGAAGAVGSAAVQIGKHMGAHVTGVASARNADTLRALGADATIDYGMTDFSRSGETWDVIMDCAGTARFRGALPALARNGRFLLVVGDLPQLLGALRKGPDGKRALGGPVPDRPADLASVAALAEQGAFRPLIGATFPFDRIVEAHRLTDSGHKRGSAVVVIADALA